MSSSSPQYHRAGFATLEVLTAIFILSVAGYGSFQLFHVGMAHHRVSQERVLAVRALNSEWECLKTIPFDRLSEHNEQAFTLEIPELETLYKATTQIRVEPHADTSAYTITLEITWIAHTGRTISEKFETLRAF